MASEVAKRLRDRRLSVWNEARGLAEQATQENRAFSPEEQGKWDALNEEIDKLDERIKAVLETEKRGKAADDAFDELSGKKPDKNAPAQRNEGERMTEARAFFRGDRGTSRFLDVVPSGPVNYRLLSSLSAGAGLDTVPTDFYDQLIAHLIEVSGVMQAGPTVLNTAGGEPLQIPKTVTHTTGAAVAQAGTIPGADPSFSMATLGSYKYGVLLQVARELLDDTGVDLIGYLSMSAGRAIGNAFGADLVNGDGSGEPTGFMHSATVGVTGTTTGKGGAAQYADLVDLEYSVIAPYRQSRSCYWMAADKTIAGFRKLVDGNLRPIWEPSAVLGTPDMLLGKPLVADPFMAASATGAQSVAFGDFSQFFVRLVGGVRFERSDDYAFNQDLTTFRALIRGDGQLVDTTGAIKVYQGPAT